MKKLAILELIVILVLAAGLLGSVVDSTRWLRYRKIYTQDQVEQKLFGQKIPASLDGTYRIGVKCLDGIKAELTVYCAKGGRYVPVIETPAVIGMNGPSKQAEGDNRTPLGSWTIGTGFGIKEDPGSKIPYVQVTDDMYWCSEPGPDYNTLRYKSENPDGDYSEDEHLIDYEGVYNYGLDMGYNAGRAPYAGNALFLHVWRGPDVGTHGCVGIPEEKMIEVLQTVTPGTTITVY